MKILKVITACSLLAISGQSFAKQTVTPIVFAKGSLCGSFNGDIVGRTFTLNLDADQDVVIKMDAFKPIYPLVKDPKGQLVDNMGAEGFFYKTKIKGKYSVVFEVEDETYPYAEVKFCAY